MGKLVSLVKKAAPLIAGVLGGPGAATATRALASQFGTTDDPDEIAKAIAADPNAAAKIRELELTQQTRWLELDVESEKNRLAHDSAETKERFQTARTALEQEGQTARIAVSSKDAFVRRARALIHYSVALVFVAKIGITCYVAIATGAHLKDLAVVFQELTWETLALLGNGALYVQARSGDKRADAGAPPQPSLAAKFLGRKKA